MSFNNRLFLIALALVVLIGIKLGLTAEATDNWKGAVISFIHLVTVAVGTVFALREDSKLN